MDINFSSGQPPENLLGYDIVQDATKALFSKERVLGGNSSPPLAYGDNYEYFSRRIGSLLETECDRQNVNHTLIVPIAGVSNGLDLLCTMLCRNLTKKGIAFVEDYTYFLSISLFEDHGLHVLSLPTDHDGILIEEFRVILENLKEDEEKLPLLLYCIPTFHNPTGRTMSQTRRIQLLDLTQQYSVNVIADEVYQFLGFTDYLPETLIANPKPVSQVTMQSYYPSFASLSPAYSHVMSISSFSKILGPGLRVGWIEFSSPQLKQMFEGLGVIRSGSSICHFASYVSVTSILCPEDFPPEQNQDLSPLQCSQFFRDICPFRRHLHALRTTLAMKYSALLSSLQKYRFKYLSPFGSPYEFLIEGHPSPSSTDPGPSFPVVGGYFLWIYLPEWIGDDLKSHETDCKVHLTSTRLLEIGRSEPYFLNFMLGATCQQSESGVPPRCRKINQTQTRDAVRMCFAKLEIEELEEGGRRFCQLLRDLQP
jgi:DNA-binding transcriptional MocR family regulator